MFVVVEVGCCKGFDRGKGVVVVQLCCHKLWWLQKRVVVYSKPDNSYGGCEGNGVVDYRLGGDSGHNVVVSVSGSDYNRLGAVFCQFLQIY